MSYKKKLRVRLIFFGLTLLFFSSVLIGFAFKEGIEFYRVPTQILKEPPSPSTKLRMGGLVEIGSLVHLGDFRIRFYVTDTLNRIEVTYDGPLPDLFSEGEGVVVQGNYNGTTFEAVQVLAKHDETYMPKEIIKALEKEGIYLKINP